MAKYLVCVFTVAVLLGGVTANMLMCVMEQMAPITPDNFILKQPDTICQDTEEKFRLARAGFRNCLGFDIDIARMESLHNEFCNPDSDFRQKAERQRECLFNHLAESLRCVSILQKSTDLINDALDPTNLDDSINNICRSSAAEMMSCLRESVGGPCGKEGKEVYGSIAEATKPLLTGSCLSAARFGIDGGVPSDDFENKFVYSSTVDSDSYAASAVTVHSFAYYLLIGLFLIVKW